MTEPVRATTDEERAQLLALGRGAAVPPPPDPIERLRQTAIERAGHPAVVHAGEALTYSELVARVARLASMLRGLGVGPESRVGICLPRGPDELIAMLATWTAGGAYVPLDTNHPRERLRVILDDAAPEVFVTERAILDLLDVPSGVRRLCLDESREAIAAREPLPLLPTERAEQLAYVLFTSGSTGRPKGVAIPRLAIASFLRSMAHTPGLGPTDRLLAITTTTFDIAELELLLPLWVGATVQIADRETAMDAQKLRAVLERDSISMLQATPTTWRILLEAGWRNEGRRVRMLCGGEAMSKELARSLAGIGELWNMYGPTETTVWSTLDRVDPEAAVISIGRPIDGTQIYLVDEAHRLVPRGEIAELYIGGIGLARGYLNRPDLTAERFIQNPYGPEGDRIYRTGDLARWLPDGRLECLGRIDHQVKIRGFRIELGEIESCLRSVAGVRETVVVAQARENDDPRLVAYCVGDAPIAALSQRASEVLPSYMRPSAYVLLESMPLNTNGKIDRARLPPPTESVDEGPGSPPRNDVEMRMAVLFQDVLNVRNVSIDRDFFALGGTSLEATELRRRIHREFGVELPLVYLFEEPSVERLAQRLSNAGPQTKPLVVQLRRGRSDAPPLLCLMGVTLYRELALALDTDRAVYGVHIPFAAEKAGKLPRIEEIAQKYTDLIAERFPQGPYHLTGLCFGGVVAFEVARGLIERSQSVATLALLDAPLPRGVSYQPRVHLNAFIEAAKAEPLVASANLLRAGRRKLQGRAETWLARAGLLREREPESPEVFEDFDVVGPVADAVVEDYDRRARPLPAPMLLFRADVRAESRWYRIADDLGWSAFVPKLHIHRVAGSHLEILREPQVRTIAQVLGRWINSGQATASKQQSAAS